MEQKLVHDLQGVPLALEQAGALLRNGYSMKELMRHYAKHYQTLMSQKPSRSAWAYDKNRSIFSAFEALYEELNDQDSASANVLILLSFLGPGEVPVALFKNFKAPVLDQAENTVHGNSMIETYNLFTAKISWLEMLTDDAAAVKAAISRLVDFTVAKARKGSDGSMRTVLVPDILRHWVQERNNLREKVCWGLVAALSVCQFLRQSDRFATLLGFQISNHVLYCIDFWNRLDVETMSLDLQETLSFILETSGRYLLRMDNPQDAKRALNSAIEIKIKIQGETWPCDRSSLQLLLAYGDTLWTLGDWENTEATLAHINSLAVLHVEENADLAVSTHSKTQLIRDRIAAGQSSVQNAVTGHSGSKNSAMNEPSSSSASTANQSPRPIDDDSSGAEDEEYQLKEILSQSEEEFGHLDILTMEARCRLGIFYQTRQDDGNAAPVLDAVMTQLAFLVLNKAEDFGRYCRILQPLLLQFLLPLLKQIQGRPDSVFLIADMFLMSQIAATINSLDLLNACLKLSPVINNLHSEDTLKHLLDLAVMNTSNDEMLQFLLPMTTSNVQETLRRGKKGDSMLHRATKSGFVSGVQILLGLKADMNGLDAKGSTPLCIATMDAVQDSDGGNGHLKIAKILLEHGANPSIPGESGDTPLHWAAHQGCDELMDLLIKARADVNALNDYLESPLCLSLDVNEKVGALLALLRYGVDLSWQDKLGRTALHITAWHGKVKYLEILLAGKADPNMIDHAGESAVHCAAGQNKEESLKLLLRYGADPDLRDNDGLTPLHRAVLEDSAACARILLEHGATVDTRDNPGFTPYMRSMNEESQKTCVKLLEEYGADIHAQLLTGPTVISQAPTTDLEDSMSTLSFEQSRPSPE